MNEELLILPPIFDRIAADGRKRGVFRQAGYACKTDGKIAVRVPDSGPDTLMEDGKKPPALDQMMRDGKWQETPTPIPQPGPELVCLHCNGTRKVTCHECRGRCTVECTTCGHDVDCEECVNGIADCDECDNARKRAMPVADRLFADHYLRMLWSAGVRELWLTLEPRGAALFLTDEIEGLLMDMKKS